MRLIWGLYAGFRGSSRHPFHGFEIRREFVGEAPTDLMLAEVCFCT